MHEISIPYTVISSAARNLFRFPPPSLSLLGEAPSPPFLRYSVSHFSLSGTLPLTANEKDPSASLGMTLRKWRFPNISFIRDVGYLFPPLPSFRAQARNPPCTLFFLAPFAEGFQFYFVTHTTLYRCARKIEGFGRDDDTEAAFSQHILYTGRGLSIPPIPSFRAQREIFLALRAFLLPSQMDSPSLLSHIGRYTGVQERSLGFARDDDTGIALSQHILYTMRGISPYDATEKSPSQSWSFFVVKRLICQTVRAWCLLLLQFQ